MAHLWALVDPTPITGAASLSIVAVTQTLQGGNLYSSTGLVGEFSIIDHDLLIPERDLWITRSRTRYALIGPGSGTGVAPKDTLTLDWVQDAQPFAWVAANPPSLLTLDWTKDGQPFASNDIAAGEIEGRSRLTLQAVTVLIPTGPVFGAISLAIHAVVDMVISGLPIVGSASLKIDANTAVSGKAVVKSTLSLSITAATNGLINVVLSGAKVTIGLTAITSMSGAGQRLVKTCEVPGAVLQLTSNLPFGLIQSDPDAIFTWQEVFTCPKDPTSTPNVPVLGYYWVIDHSPNTIPSYNNSFTRVPNEEILLNGDGYGSGNYWFHVIAVNWTGLGAAAHYNVIYDIVTSAPGLDGMWIDGLDTLMNLPLVAQVPIDPHQLTWSLSVDSLIGRVLLYEVQISKTPDFDINSDSGVDDIVLDTQNILGDSLILDNLEPGIYFWRIRTWDGVQNSAWSPVGRFRINAPPLRPYDLSVLQTV